jgi:hypothetical protein
LRFAVKAPLYRCFCTSGTECRSFYLREFIAHRRCEIMLSIRLFFDRASAHRPQADAIRLYDASRQVRQAYTWTKSFPSTSLQRIQVRRAALRSSSKFEKWNRAAPDPTLRIHFRHADPKVRSCTPRIVVPRLLITEWMERRAPTLGDETDEAVLRRSSHIETDAFT